MAGAVAARTASPAAMVFLTVVAAVLGQAQGVNPESDTVERVILPHIRERFYDVVDDETTTQELIAYIEGQFTSDPSVYPPVVKGYYAALEGLRGRHDDNPLRKYRFVTDAIAMMNPLVEAHPELLEVRFLRFSFYEQIPGLFGARHHVRQDLAEIIQMLSTGQGTEVPLPVRLDMIEYILDTREPTAEQRRLLRELQVQPG